MPALRRRVSTVLIASQILGGLGISTGVALAAVLAEEVSGTGSLAGLAPTATVAGTAALSLPLAALMNARGRRAGLSLAYLIGALGAAIVVVAAVWESFPLLLFGMAAFGASTSANLQARFAAADLADPSARARAISHVVWATTVGAVLGPNIAGPAGATVRGLGVPEAAGPFVWAAGAFLVSALVVIVFMRPDPLLVARSLAPGGGALRREGTLRAGLTSVTASPRARLALVTVALGHTVMVGVMAMTPVHLGHHGAGIQLIGLVISGHIAGMYAFSPVMGWLSDRLGRDAVIVLAVVLLAVATLLAGVSGGSHGLTAAGLFLLGLGWSAALVAGSALLTESVPEPARAAAQGLSDLVMSAAAGVGGALSGLVVATAGYGWLNLLAALLLLPLCVLSWTNRRGARPTERRGTRP
ncbi:MFS transporter [Streptomyces sp. JNUCC 64]